MFVTAVQEHLQNNADVAIELVYRASSDPLFEYVEQLMTTFGEPIFVQPPPLDDPE